MKLMTALGAMAALTSFGEIEPLFRITPEYRYSWKTYSEKTVRQRDYLKLTADPAKEVTWSRGPKTENYFPCYCASEKAVVTFTYRSDVPVDFGSRIIALGRENGTAPTYFGTSVPASKDWKPFRCEIQVPRQELDSGSIRFTLAKGTGTFEVKDLRIDEAEPARKGGMPLMLDGKPATEICVIRSDDPMRHRSEMKAALVLRYALYFNGGVYLPVKTIASADEAAPVSVVIGGASARVGKGGYEMALKNGRLTIAAAIPCGPQFGAFRLLEKLGIRYLGTDFWAKPQKLELTAFETVETPDIPYRTVQGRFGSMPELKGYVSEQEVVADSAPAGNQGHSELYHHPLGQIIPIEEFEKTRPEYFAMKKDGTRLTSKDCTWVTVKYCYSNPDLAELVAKRFGEIFDSQPTTFMVTTLAGDGEQFLCECPVCRAAPSVSDITYGFVNRVAKRLAETNPRVHPLLISYVDNPEPPKGAFEPPCANLKLRHCVYPANYWDAANIWDDPANARGHKAVADWRKIFPDLSYSLYFSGSDGEFLGFHPDFDFTVEAIRDSAKHHALDTNFLGLWGAHDRATLNHGAFMDVIEYVVARVAMEADYDVEAGLDEIFPALYGAAAKPMRALFDRTRGLYRRQHWVNNFEDNKRGLFTEDFSTECLGYLDAALAAAKGDARLATYILCEKQMFLYTYLKDVCRGRGNVPRTLFPTWAKRVGSFCAITKKLGTGYMDWSPVTYFHDCMLYDISESKRGRYDWWTVPEIDALIADPEKALGADFPNRAKNTEKGLLIPATGMIGGQFTEQSRWMTKTPVDARCLRRESSGFGLLQTSFDLEAVPAQGVKLVIEGIRSEKKDDYPQMVVEVNGTKVFDGLAKWAGDRWDFYAYEVPAAALVKGRNDLVIKNPTPDPEAKFDGAGGANFRVKRDYNKSWFSVVSIAVEWK